MQKRIRFTPEEKQADRKDILKMLKQGMSYSEMETEIGRTIAYISLVKIELVKDGQITDDVIKQAKDARKDRENQEFDAKVLELYNLNISPSQIALDLKRHYNDVKAAIQRLLDAGKITLRAKNSRRNSKEPQIIEALNAKKSVPKISRELGIPITTLNRWISSMIDEGKIDNSLIEKNRRLVEKKETERKKRIKKENQAPYVPNELASKVLSCLKDGCTYASIAKQLQISPSELLAIITELKKHKIITQKEIDEARTAQIQRDAEKILGFLQHGYSETEILHEMPGLYSAYISRIVSKLKKNKVITDEQIKAYRYNSKNGAAEKKKFILAKLKQGYTVAEIEEAGKEYGLTERPIRDFIKELVESGEITKEEIKSKRLSRSKQNNKRNYEEIDEKIYSHIKSGYSFSGIATKIDMSYDFVLRRKKHIMNEKKLTSQKLRKFRTDALKKLNAKQTKLRDKVQDTLTESSKKFSDYRKDFLGNSMTMIELGLTLTECDLRILEDIVLFDETFVNKPTLQFIVAQYLRNGNYQRIIHFMNDCLTTYEGTMFYDCIQSVNFFTIQTMKKEKAIRLLNKRMAPEVVAEETGLKLIEIFEIQRRFC